MNYYDDKSGNKIGIGSYVITRTKECGEIVKVESWDEKIYMVVLSKGRTSEFFPHNLQRITTEEAMLWKLEQ
jgi:hypothetical protein